MDKFVVQSKRSTDVEDDNSPNEANKKTKPSTSTQVSDSQRYMASKKNVCICIVSSPVFAENIEMPLTSFSLAIFHN